MIKKNNQKKIFFCADDFGLNKITNERIIRLIEKHKIQRVSIMIGKKSDFSFLEELKNSPVKIDLHLTLNNWGESIAENKNILVRIFEFLKKLFWIRSIEKKWQTQIDDFKKIFERHPDGLNSHEHIHFFPAFYPIFFKLARHNNIKYIRNNRKIVGQGFIAWILRILGKINLIWQKKNTALEENDYLSCFDWIDFNAEFIEKYQHKKIEIICHPKKDVDFEKMLKI